MHAQDAYHLGCPRVEHSSGSLDTRRLLEIYYDACVRCFRARVFDYALIPARASPPSIPAKNNSTTKVTETFSCIPERWVFLTRVML